MCVNSLSQGLNVDLPKAGLELQTSRSESRASTTTPRRHTSATTSSLELDLDLDVSVQAGSRHVCAVLRCQEERQLASTSHTQQDQSSAPFKNITSLTVFRADSSTPSGKQGGNLPGVVMATLTSQQPRLIRVSNGVKVAGVLDGKRASLTLELTKSNDCMADFVCQVQTVNANGELSLTSARVLQNKRQQGKDNQMLSFEQLATSINQSAVETLSSANKLFIRTNSTTAMLIKDVLSPKRCTKGVISVLSHASYPYPLIQPSEDSIVDVPHLCDIVTDGGGWIIIQRRSTGDVDFYQRGWEEYKNGFGDLRGDFWLGNEHIHRITNSGQYELRVELVYQGKSFYARYGQFSISDETSQYTLNVADYSGTAGDAMINGSQGRQFTTIDRDNDLKRNRNCAESWMGGWWYHSCGYSGLNGKWQESNFKGLIWFPVSGSNSLSFSEMKIRHV
ncbi:fibrinogen related protein 12.1 [Elysia marginata]|uniref:Fibrinogen related protein 12.1 n=1 Tax=Elysia marginata TaxID=1093978 RepID=A0AAV4HSS3_9GAST|nr:fibrinogen related protein 12.1 [Elysia marginata]